MTPHMHRFWHPLALGILAALLALNSWPAAAQGPKTFDRAHFGVVEAFYRPSDARELGVGWERIIFDWAQFQPDNPRQFETSAVPEEWLAAARDGGREVVGLIKSTPFWASGGDKIGCPPRHLELPIDDPANYWAAFVRRVVSYYRDEWGINHWIILNEPDIRPGDLSWYEFDGSVEDYYRMLKVAYLAAKDANPDAVIHLAGMAWWVDITANRPLYLKRLLDRIAQDDEAYEHGFFFDVAMVHTYFGTLNVWNVISDTRSMLWHYDLQHKPIWVDETNAMPSDDPLVELPKTSYAVTLEQQAAFIVQSAALSLAAGVDRFGVYRLYDDHYTPGITEPWGLVRGDGSRRPAYDAYQTVIDTFGGTIRARRHWSDRSSLVILERDERTVYVMWARGEDPVRFHILAAHGEEQATQVSLDGIESPLAATYLHTVEDWGWWFTAEAPGAAPDRDGEILVEGAPLIVAVEGPPRSVWIEVKGAQWRFR